MGRIMSMSQLVMALALVASLLQGTAADNYTVGDSAGWVSTQSADFYSTWAKNFTFKVGDDLVFNFNTNQHDVAVVNQEVFDSCNTANINADYTAGPATVRLNATGPMYFICTFTGHCARQKLSITVVSDDGNPSPSPPTGTTTPTPGTNTTSPSSASPRGVAFAFVFMSLAIAFFCC